MNLHNSAAFPGKCFIPYNLVLCVPEELLNLGLFLSLLCNPSKPDSKETEHNNAP